MDITTFIWEVGAALVMPVLVVIAGALLLIRQDGADLETRKVRFAAAMFTGILALFIFAAVLYYGQCMSSCNGSGEKIFDKAVTAMTPLAGAIVGYFFGTHKSGSSQNPGVNKEIRKK